jgi:hypothetical protein
MGFKLSDWETKLESHSTAEQTTFLLTEGLKVIFLKYHKALMGLCASQPEFKYWVTELNASKYNTVVCWTRWTWWKSKNSPWTTTFRSQVFTLPDFRVVEPLNQKHFKLRQKPALLTRTCHDRFVYICRVLNGRPADPWNARLVSRIPF